jgi:thiol-disulfide isomerase/thioredoxin
MNKVKNTFLFGLLLYVNVLAQDYNTIITDEKSGKPMLIGFTTLEAFNDTSFSWWWNSGYDIYNVDSAAASKLSYEMKNINLTVVMGTWCSDSRREVPRFYKILDKISYPTEKVILINVDREKHGLADEVDLLGIDFIPTFILSKDGKELGRIVESPYESLEKDMSEILTADSNK